MTDALDVANGYDGTYVGGVSEAGLVGIDTAVSFTSSNRVDLPADAFLPDTSDLTIIIWHEYTSAGGSPLFELIAQVIGSHQLDIDLLGTGQVFVSMSKTPSGGQSFTGAVSLSTSTRHMIAVTRDASTETWKIYVDGSLDTSHTFGSAALLSGAGSQATLGDSNGTYDEVATFYSELSSADIADLWALRDDFFAYSDAVLALDPRNYYHLDELGGGPPVRGGWVVGQIGMGG